MVGLSNPCRIPRRVNTILRLSSTAITTTRALRSFPMASLHNSPYISIQTQTLSLSLSLSLTRAHPHRKPLIPLRRALACRPRIPREKVCLPQKINGFEILPLLVRNLTFSYSRPRLNVGALFSARFRTKKKQRSSNLERSVSDLTGRAEELEREASELRQENKWLKEIVILKGRSLAGGSQSGGGSGNRGDDDSDSDSDKSDGAQKKRKGKEKKKADK
jgi:hypothetical protein